MVMVEGVIGVPLLLWLWSLLVDDDISSIDGGGGGCTNCNVAIHRPSDACSTLSAFHNTVVDVWDDVVVPVVVQGKIIYDDDDNNDDEDLVVPVVDDTTGEIMIGMTMGDGGDDEEEEKVPALLLLVSSPRPSAATPTTVRWCNILSICFGCYLFGVWLERGDVPLTER